MFCISLSKERKDHTCSVEIEVEEGSGEIYQPMLVGPV